MLSKSIVFGDWEQKQIISLAAGVGIFLVTWVALLITKRIVWNRLRAFAEKTPQQWDDALLAALTRPTHLLLFVVSISAGLQSVPNKLQAIPAVTQANKIVFILIAAWILDRLFGVLVRHSSLPGNLGESGRSLLLAVIRVLFLSIILLIILDTLGISITPLLASLGVGSIAVALALQDTLGNLFSGVYMIIDRPIRIGDYIRLDAGIEGYVKQIGWRSTRLELMSSSMVVIPNNKLSSSILTNFNLPVTECSTSVDVGVSYDSDLAHVERVAMEIGRNAQNTLPFAVSGAEPSVRFHTFGDSAIGMALWLRAKSYADIAPLRHEVVKTIHERFRHEKIGIPYPHRVIQQN